MTRGRQLGSCNIEAANSQQTEFHIRLTAISPAWSARLMLVGIAAGVAERPIFLASLVYSICLLTMLRLLGSLQPRLQCIPTRVSPPA